MSYDAYLCDPVSGDTLVFDEKHQMTGGTYVVGGTREARLNITYNYCKTFVRVLGFNIRELTGKSGAETIPLLKEAIGKLKDDVSQDYWEETDGNVKKALCQLLAISQMRPDGVWRIE